MRLPNRRDKPARNLTEGSLVRNIWHLALPTLTAYAFMDAFNIVDMIFVGRLGPSAIAAVSMCGVLLGVIRMVAIGVRTGTVAMVSRFVGGGNREAARVVLAQSLILSLFFSAAVAVAGYFLAEPVLLALGAADEVLSLGVSYFRIMCVGGFTMFMLMTMGGGLRGFGDAVTPMKAMAIASVLNIGLDPLLIFGIGPFPSMGVAGSALATVIARGIGSVILLIIMLKGKSDLQLGGASLHVNWGTIGRIVRIGLFSTLRSLSMNVSRIVLVRIIVVFGTNAVAAYGIGMRLRIFLLMLGFGLGDAAAILVGQNLGASKPARAEKSAWIAAGFYGVFMALMCVVFLVFSEGIIGIFSTDPEVLDLGGSYLRFFAIALLFLDLSIILGRAMSGAGDTLAPMVITAVSLIAVGIPLVWFFSRTWGITGVWIALVATEVLQGIGMILWFRVGRWKLKRV